MGAVAADTHALVWYLFEPQRLSASALQAFDAAASGGEAIVCSAITIVELVYLVEKGRLPGVVLERIGAVLSEADAGLEVVPLTREIAGALKRVPRDEVPDMPDRIIATALELGLPLVTRDGKIRATSLQTVW